MRRLPARTSAMAMSDYRLCDVCGGKAFYDANLDYRFDPVAPEQLPYGCGAWAVLCRVCVATHEVSVQPLALTASAATSAARTAPEAM